MQAFVLVANYCDRATIANLRLVYRMLKLRPCNITTGLLDRLAHYLSTQGTANLSVIKFKNASTAPTIQMCPKSNILFAAIVDKPVDYTSYYIVVLYTGRINRLLNENIEYCTTVRAMNHMGQYIGGVIRCAVDWNGESATLIPTPIINTMRGILATSSTVYDALSESQSTIISLREQNSQQAQSIAYLTGEVKRVYCEFELNNAQPAPQTTNQQLIVYSILATILICMLTIAIIILSIFVGQ